MRIRTAVLVLTGLLLFAGVSALEAQERDTSSALAPSIPKPAKAKAGRARTGDAATKGIVPPKTKTAPTLQRVDSLPAIAKPPKPAPASA